MLTKDVYTTINELRRSQKRMFINQGYHDACSSKSSIDPRNPVKLSQNAQINPIHINVVSLFARYIGATTSVALFFESQLLCFENVFILRLLAAVCGVQIPMNRSSHSSSSWLSNSISSNVPDLLFVATPPASSIASAWPSQPLLRHVFLVSSMNLPTLYCWDSSSAATYFHPSTLPHCAQLMSLTVCAPVTSCRGTGL
jgi:hypothetical protein